uniref:Uncharacterized protein n=1 Tax=Rhizophora mucronata TaxID=61149 RepID=A0A2P2QJ75_RHIMU
MGIRCSAREPTSYSRLMKMDNESGRKNIMIREVCKIPLLIFERIQRFTSFLKRLSIHTHGKI